MPASGQFNCVQATGDVFACAHALMDGILVSLRGLCGFVSEPASTARGASGGIIELITLAARFGRHTCFQVSAAGDKQFVNRITKSPDGISFWAFFCVVLLAPRKYYDRVDSEICEFLITNWILKVFMVL